ncbi:Transcription activator of gluconeogenesis ERT1 [Trametes pubescens]|uniref:Transcription activator of gluconeogenesis ERT1 n=1 Tax=Trametes pubescens TaxID=154538 RepID=A0A1M2VSC8_TRAPU|nr:Transcription activator of gluconeogenesis ERT1 [Trametes pubescens]
MSAHTPVRAVQGVARALSPSPFHARILIITSVARPCQRCIKRGMADNCTEGHRKKAKYLLDEEELGKRHMTSTASALAHRAKFIQFRSFEAG